MCQGMTFLLTFPHRQNSLPHNFVESHAGFPVFEDEMLFVELLLFAVEGSDMLSETKNLLKASAADKRPPCARSSSCGLIFSSVAVFHLCN